MLYYIMPKFFNKNELVLLMLIILMFDVNGFCEVSLQHIVNTNKRSFALFFMTLFFMTYSIYVYHMVCYTVAPPSVTYAVSHKHEIPTCAEQVEEIIKTNLDAVDEMARNCDEHINKGIYLSERLALTIIPIIILIFMYVAIYKVDEGEGINSQNTRILLSVPAILLSCSILSFAHIYLPFFKK